MGLPLSTFVCWNCRRSDVTLLRIKDEDGKKTEDYVCVNCVTLHPAPPIGNFSKVHFPTMPIKINLGREKYLAEHEKPIGA